MTTAQKKPSVELLRSALKESTGDPVVDQMARQSLLAGIVGDDAELLQVYVEEAGPPQVEVDLHLQGEGVHGHTTNARHFAVFISRIADAVKETAKDIAGKERYTTGLLIEGALPGSVRVVLRAPEETLTQDALTGTEGSNIDSQALRRIAQVITLASEDDTPDGGPLEGAVQQIPPRARVHLKTAVREAKKANWDIDGTIKERRKGISDVRLSHNGAVRLETMLGRAHEAHRIERVIGTVDGLKHSLGVMWFIPSTGTRSFGATVQDDKLLAHVAELARDRTREVVATFDTYTSIDGERDTVVKKSRVLRTIDATSTVSEDPMIDPTMRVRSEAEPDRGPDSPISE